MKKEIINIDGADIEVLKEKVGNTLWFHFDGETHSLEVLKRKGKKSAAGSQAQPGVLVAPMPGKIMKLHCKTGDEVKVGQEILAMGAMKMEYVLKSDIDGRVIEMNCSEEEQVSQSQTLVVIEETESVS